MSVSYCGLNCNKCDFHKVKICSGCKSKKKDWGCSIRKCGQSKKIDSCLSCKNANCKNYKKIIYKIARPFMPFNLEKRRKEYLANKNMESK